MTIKQTFSSFDDLIKNSPIPVLVSFYASWCGYCKQFAPTLEQVKAQMGDRIKVVRVDSEKYSKLASQYEVQALPTTLIFIEGELASRIKGGMEASKLIEYIHKLLNS